MAARHSRPEDRRPPSCGLEHGFGRGAESEPGRALRGGHFTDPGPADPSRAARPSAAAFAEDPGFRVQRARNERRLGNLLRRMRELRLYRPLGFVRLGDYVEERLGLSYRTAQELMRTDEALADLPVTAAAFETGQIPGTHVRALSRIATARDERRWLSLALRTGARDFESRISFALRAAGRGEDLTAAGDARVLLQIQAPAWIATLWRETRIHVRRLTGRHALSGECLETVLAEFGSSSAAGLCDGDGSGPGCPEDEEAATGMVPADAGSASAAGLGEGEDSGPGCPEDEEAATGMVLADAGSASAAGLGEGEGSGPGCPEGGGTAAGTPDTGAREAAAARETSRTEARTTAPRRKPNRSVSSLFGPRLSVGETWEAIQAGPAAARAADQELRRLAAGRQRHEALLAEHLRMVAETRRYRSLGYSSLKGYATNRLGISARRLCYLLALQRSLRSLKHLREAFMEGRLTLRKAILVAGVATAAAERAWVARASAVTLRRLEDEVSYWCHLRETRPGVWELLKGDPLPEGLVLVPGQPPRSRRHGSDAESPEDSEGDVHGSAPPAGSHEDAGVEVHGSARLLDAAGGSAATADGPAVTAEALLEALEEDERAVPLPGRLVRLVIRVEPEVSLMWEDAVARCREGLGREIRASDVLGIVLTSFWRSWDNAEIRRQRRRHPTLERDGWRCTAPGCRSTGSGRLQEHHIVFRSAGGALAGPGNLTTLCTAHHLGLLHRGWVRCRGEAPDRILWEMGVHPGGGTWLIFENEREVGGAA